ncbi:Nek protein kinase, partial [Globisporangium splendens]
MDKYAKLAKIGQGSFGCAYLVTRKNDPNTQQPKKYVIKEIRIDPRDDQQTALREAKLLAALDHPNIIACKESFLVKPQPHQRLAPQVLCIVTEYADGGDLRRLLEQHVARRTRLLEHEILDLFVQLCLALKHLHDRKILHRDLKPESIFLMRAGSSSKNVIVKMGDFGVATVLSHTLACAATMTGTPYYTSPEICLSKRYNQKTDIWSLGCILYELLTFTHAFNGRNQRQLFDNIVNAKFAPIPVSRDGGIRGGGYSKRLVDLVATMLAKSPRERPSVNQILKAPVVMERIQKFLSERAMADELNHTVLHGHHIFAKQQQLNKMSPPPKARAVEAAKSPPPAPAPVTKPNAVVATAAHVVRHAELVLKEKKKEAARPLASPLPPPPPKSVEKRVSAVLAMKKLLGAKQKKPAVNSGAAALLKKSRPFKKQSPLRGGVVAAPSPRGLTPTAKALKNRLVPQKQKANPVEMLRVQSAAKPLSAVADAGAGVSDRISAFNAQWQAQRQQLLQNLPPPPAAPNAPSGALPLPPAPVVAAPTPKNAAAYPMPVVIVASSNEKSFVPPTSKTRGAVLVKAAATKQRDAVRKDIRHRKLALMKKSGASNEDNCAATVKVAVVKMGTRARARSPLDGSVILVRNLPAYESLSPPAGESAAALQLCLPPPAPVAVVVPTPSGLEAAHAGGIGEDLEDEVQNGDDGDEDNSQKQYSPGNLEFERMVLQLKSVVESSSSLEDDVSDDDTEEDGNEELRHADMGDNSSAHTPTEVLEATSPLPPAYTAHASLSTLSVAMLEDPAFKTALRALLMTQDVASAMKTESEGDSQAAEAAMRGVRPEQTQALRWMQQCVASVHIK